MLHTRNTEVGCHESTSGGWTSVTPNQSSATTGRQTTSRSATPQVPTATTTTSSSFSLEENKRRQDDLDELLASLDRLTETFPDLSSLKTGASGNMSAVADVVDSNVRPSQILSRTSGMDRSANNRPYHSRQDSRPFSYIRSNGGGGSTASSNCIFGASSKEAVGGQASGLESPNLLRRILSANDYASSTDGGCSSRPLSPASARSSPFPQKAVLDSGGGADDDVVVSFQQNLSQQRQRNYDFQSPATLYSTVNKLNRKADGEAETKTTSRLLRDLEPNATVEEASSTWLQRQQKKLMDRRERERRKESLRRDGDVMKELKTSLDAARNDGPTFDVVATISPKQTKSFSSASGDSHQVAIGSSGIPLSAKALLLLQRQKSDLSHDRTRPTLGPGRRLRYGSEGEEAAGDYFHLCQKHPTMTTATFIENRPSSTTPDVIYGSKSLPASRPITPGFPSTCPATPYFNQSSTSSPSQVYQRLVQQRLLNQNGGGRSSPSPSYASIASSIHLHPAGSCTVSRRESASSSSEPLTVVAAHHTKRAKDSHKFWYKPTASREEAISMLQHHPAGTFVVRDSNSFPGAFGLALKVAAVKTNVDGGLSSDELVRHFLIEPTRKGVRLKGYANEPPFASLSALVYQHTLTSMALPTILRLPASDLAACSSDSADSAASNSALQMQQLLNLGAACNVLYLFTMDTDTLTGSGALQKTVSQLLVLASNNAAPSSAMATCVHFKVSSKGITLTDNARRLFFRKHYNTHAISFCGIDPEERRWQSDDRGQGKKDGGGDVIRSAKMFGFVARKPTSRSGHNQCHVFAELDPEQPARAIVNFVNKVLASIASASRSRSLSARRHGDVV